MIKSTLEYNIFKKHELNREIDETNLKKIINSIKSKNLLHLRPLIVDENFNIIDGQHRLEAARLLKLPIFYEVQKDIASEDIVLLNANQKNWTHKDYYNYYCSAGNSEYTKLKEFINKYKLDYSIALAILKNYGGDPAFKFKKGLFKFPDDLSSALELLFCIKEIQKLICERYAGDTKFCTRLGFVKSIILFLNIDIDFDKFIKNIEIKMNWLKSCSSIPDYLHIFKQIYNFKNKDQLE